MAKFLHELGFRALNVDLNIFVKKDTIIIIYLDNLLIYDAEKKYINKIKNVLKSKFHMSDLRLVLFYLRIAVI